MPNESLSVYLTAVDGISPVFASITDKTRALDKESQELVQTYDALQKANKGLIAQKVELQKELKAVNEDVKAAKKQFAELGDEASSDALDKAMEKQQGLKDKIAATSAAMRENQRIFKDNMEAIRKGSIEEQGTSLGGKLTGDRMAMGLISGQVGQMLSSSVGGFAKYFAESALGIPSAALLSNGLSNAISGALAGSVFGVPGAVFGGLGGALSGLLAGKTEILEAKDDAFKEYYGGLYDDVKGRSAEMVEAGSTIAGGREQTRMAFSQRLGGDDEAAAYLAQVETMAAKTNYEYDEITGYAKLLLNSYDPDETFDVLQKLSDATAGLNLSSSDVNMMISGLSRMRTTGKATQEYLNYFRERGVDVDQALADDLNVDKSSIAGMVTKGQISGEDAAQAILDYIEESFGGLSDNLASTYDAMVDNLGDMTASLQAKGGNAYNELRKEGLQAEMDAYEGELGDALGEINRIMGENQARKENLQEQYMREVRDAVLTGDRGELWDTFNHDQQFDLMQMRGKYARLMKQYEESDRTDFEAAAELESLYEQTEALGQAYFENSDFMQKLNDVEEDEITAIRDMTAGLNEATQAAYNVSQALSKGYGAADTRPGEYHVIDMQGKRLGIDLALSSKTSSSHAYGLGRVPYDEYPALLHRDERVLTASEARAQDAGQGGHVNLTITGNSFAGMPENMADQLWEIIVRKLERAYTAKAPK